MNWVGEAGRELGQIEEAGRLRSVRDFDARGQSGTIDGAPVTSFASNDYLGLSAHPLVVAAAHEALDRWGSGSGSARLIAGSRPIHSALERALAEWTGCESAALFASGYSANLGVLAVVGGAGVTIFSDELNHASIVDGCRLARAHVVVYPHLDLGRLDALLRGTARAVVATDTVFSMDGDIAPADDLVELCRRRGALLIVDEAHAVLGPDFRTRGAEVLRVGTLSKFLASAGGFVAGPAALVDLLVNRARSFIYTTASPPSNAAAALSALSVLRSTEGDALRARLSGHVRRIAPAHPSPIVPVLLGDENSALEASQALLERGLFVPAIRPPSVPPGSARLRVTLSAAHTAAEVDALQQALAILGTVKIGA